MTVIAIALVATAAHADTFRVHYSVRGSGRDITVQAESSAEARRVVMEIIPRGSCHRSPEDRKVNKFIPIIQFLRPDAEQRLVSPLPTLRASASAL